MKQKKRINLRFSLGICIIIPTPAENVAAPFNKSLFLIPTQNSHDSSHRKPSIVEFFSVDASANP